MNFKYLAVSLFLVSLIMTGFAHVHGNAGAPFCYQMVILGLFALKSFKPVWVWGSWLSNVGFFLCLFRPFTRTGLKARRAIAVASVVLGLSFLAVSEYLASGGGGHTTRYYWAEIEPAGGYFVWLASLICMAVHYLWSEPEPYEQAPER